MGTDSSRMVFIPKHLGDVPGSVSFLLAPTIAQGCYKTPNDEAEKKKSHNYMRKVSIKDYGWIASLLLKQTSEYGLMIMLIFLWEAMGLFFCTAKYILFLSMFNIIKEFRTIFRHQSL